MNTNDIRNDLNLLNDDTNELDSIRIPKKSFAYNLDSKIMFELTMENLYLEVVEFPEKFDLTDEDIAPYLEYEEDAISDIKPTLMNLLYKNGWVELKTAD